MTYPPERSRTFIVQVWGRLNCLACQGGWPAVLVGLVHLHSKPSWWCTRAGKLNWVVTQGWGNPCGLDRAKPFLPVSGFVPQCGALTGLLGRTLSCMVFLVPDWSQARYLVVLVPVYVVTFVLVRWGLARVNPRRFAHPLGWAVPEALRTAPEICAALDRFRWTAILLFSYTMGTAMAGGVAFHLYVRLWYSTTWAGFNVPYFALRDAAHLIRDKISYAHLSEEVRFALLDMHYRVEQVHSLSVPLLNSIERDRVSFKVEVCVLVGLLVGYFFFRRYRARRALVLFVPTVQLPRGWPRFVYPVLLVAGLFGVGLHWWRSGEDVVDYAGRFFFGETTPTGVAAQLDRYRRWTLFSGLATSLLFYVGWGFTLAAFVSYRFAALGAQGLQAATSAFSEIRSRLSADHQFDWLMLENLYYELLHDLTQLEGQIDLAFNGAPLWWWMFVRAVFGLVVMTVLSWALYRGRTPRGSGDDKNPPSGGIF